MNSIFEKFLTANTPSNSLSVTDTPAQQAKAVLLIEKETGLNGEDVLDFLVILGEKKEIVDMYNSLSDPDLRTKYVQRILKKHRDTPADSM